MRAIKIKREFLRLIHDRNFILSFLFFALVFWIFWVNAPHERYPDEFDNILGGKYILQGKIIYGDWFTHHGPLAYYVSAIVNIFSGNSFVHFRYVYAIFLFLLTVGSYLFIRRRLPGENTNFYLLFIFLLSIASTYFWGQMLLADNLSAFLLAPVFGLVILKAIGNRKFETPDYLFISIFSFLALMSALTFAFLVAGIYAFLILYYFYQERRKFNILESVKILAIIIVPYIVFVIYLLITGTLDDYYVDAIKFNRDYYIYYPGLEGKPPTNPIRYAIVILQGFHNNYSSLLLHARDFNLTYPINITFALGNLCFGIYLLLKKKYLALIFLIGALVYANARTNPLDSKETDYQAAVYMLFSLFSISYVLPKLYEEINLNIESAKKLIFSLLFVLLLIYSFFGLTYLLRKFSYKVYNRYMGQAAGIYDGPRIAPYMNRLVTADETSWIGPFAFEELYYLNSNIPSKYQVYLPGMGQSQEMTGRLVSEFQDKKPKVIYYDKDAYILGNDPKKYGKPFINFLDKNYITLSQYKDGSLTYSDSVDKSLLLEQKLYINKDNSDEIIDRMKREGMIKE